MAVGVKCGSFTKSGTSNTIGTTFKVKALIVFGTGVGAASAGTYQGDGALQIGISDGTTNYLSAIRVDDGAATSDTYITWNGYVAATYSATATMQDTGVATFGASTDFTITWTNGGTPQTPVFYYIALGGDDITNAKVNFQDLTSSSGNIGYTGIGFQPDWGFFIKPGIKVSLGDSLTFANNTIGSVMSTSRRWSMSYLDEDGSNTQDSWAWHQSDQIIANLNNAGAIASEADFVSWDTDGYTLNWTNAPNAGDDLVGLFIKGGVWDVDTFTKPTTTGAQDQIVTLNNSTLTPKLVILASVQQVASASPVNRLLTMAFGATDGTSEGCVYMGSGPDTSDPMINAEVHLNNKVLRLATANATEANTATNAECSIVTGGSMATAGQFTLDWTTVDSTTAHQISYIVLGEVVTGEQYNRSPSTDSTTISDSSLTRLLSAARAPSIDSPAISESSLTRMLSLARVPSSDDTTISDSSLTAVRVKSGIPSTDSTTITDSSLVRMLSSTRVPNSETSELSENLTRMTQAFRTPSEDTTAITDSSLVRIRSLPRVPSSDDTTITDSSLIRLLSSIRVPSTETETISDSALTRIYSSLRLPSQDTTSLSEDITSEKTAGAQVIERAPSADSTTITESSLVRLYSSLRLPSTDTITITEDSLVRLLQAFRIPEQDTVTIGESVSGGKLFERIPSTDTITISEDGISRLLSASRTLEESENISDFSLTRLLSAIRIPSQDTTNLSEDVTGQHITAGQFNRSVGPDTVILTESSLTRLLQLARLPTTDTTDIIDSSLVGLRNLPRIPSTDTITISDSSLIRLLSLVRTPSLDSTSVIDSSLTRMLQSFRLPSVEIISVNESLSGGRIFPRIPTTENVTVTAGTTARALSSLRVIEESIESIEASLSRMLSSIRSLEDIVTISEVQAFLTQIRMIEETIITGDISLNTALVLVRSPFVESVTVSELLSTTGGTPSELVVYATVDEVRMLLGNLGAQRATNDINRAIEAATDTINRRTNRIPPYNWRSTEEEFDLIKKLARYIAALEMSIGIAGFEESRTEMQKEINEIFTIIEEHDPGGITSNDMVITSESATYPSNTEEGIIWSTRYKDLGVKKRRIRFRR